MRILVVDGAREHADVVREFLHLGGAWPDADVQVAATYDDAVRALERCVFDLAFLDYCPGSRDGLTLLHDIRSRGVPTPVIVLTSRGAEEVAVEAMKAGAADYLTKANLTIETLERAMRYALALQAEQQHSADAEAALRASEERFRALVENSSDALMLIDAQGRVTYMAPSAMRHLGWTAEQMVGRSVLEFVHPDDLAVATRRLAETREASGIPITTEVRFRHADGDWRIMEGVGVNHLDDPSVRAIVVTARDLTDRRRLEAQLRMSQKMEAIGQLAGGVAHDFNNLLTAILGYCNLLLDEVPVESPQRGDLEEIRSAGERAAALTSQLLAFSRRQMLQPRIIDVNDSIRQLEKPLRRLISGDVELVTNLAPELMPVKVDPASVDQILVSLAVNARDAMPAGGRLTIETSNVELAADFGDTPALVVPGPQCPRHCRRHRSRHGRGHAGTRFRAVLYNKGTGQRQRPRSRDRLWHREAERRVHLRREPPRGGHGLQDVLYRPRSPPACLPETTDYRRTAQ